MKIAVDVKTMRESDAQTIKSGVLGTELMRRAGKGIFEARRDWGKTAVVCGSGNNAGDGYVLALLLCEAGNYVELFLCGEKFSADGKYYFDKCLEKNIPYSVITEDTDLSGFDTVADCLLGTGFRGAPEGNVLLAINKINRSGAFVVSADINSGLSGDSGIAAGKCVKSDLTVSVGFYKTGHFLGSAKDKISSLVNADIGIELCGKSVFVPEISDFCDIFYRRLRNTHKGTYGYVAIMGGSAEYCGAAKLSNLAMSALRAGCGVAKLCTPKSMMNAVAPYLLESTWFPMDDIDGHMIYDGEKIDALCRGCRAVSVGMGWGTGADNAKILSHLLKNFTGTLIIDADGLNTISREKEKQDLLCGFSCEKVILTPHPLEFSRISGYEMSEISENPVECAENYARSQKGRVILLLKGASTVITDGTETYITDTGCAGMACAGSGDVLSGVLTGICGYSAPTVKAVACGAFSAGLAGEFAARENGDISMTSSDTVKFLPHAVKAMCEKQISTQ